jgi:predicted NBD/HSP70 family sugar kinase
MISVPAFTVIAGVAEVTDSRFEFAGAKPGPGELLALIRRGAPATRAELAARTGLGRAAVADRLGVLLALDLLRDAGGAPSRPGRTATRLAFNPAAGLVMAAALGVTHGRLALADLSGKAIAEERLELAIASGPEPVIETVADRFAALLERVGLSEPHVRAIGIGVPGPVEHASGRPVSPPMMPGWDGYPIPGRLKERFAVPVLVDNDVNVMALGEHATEWADRDSIIFVEVGTGIGCGILANGQIYRGGQGAAGDIGHVAVAGRDDAVCECGNRGCVDAVASGRALIKDARGRGLDVRSTTEFVMRVAAHEPVAVQLAREAGRRLGQVLSGLVSCLNPSVIVVGGDIASTGDPLFAGVREIVYERSTALATRELVIVPSGLGDRAGVVGAALMAVEHVLDPRRLNSLSGMNGPIQTDPRTFEAAPAPTPTEGRA